MNATLLDAQVPFYRDLQDGAQPSHVLCAGARVTLGASRSFGGKEWAAATDPFGNTGFIPGDANVFRVQKATLLQSSAVVRDQPGPNAPIQRQLQQDEPFLIVGQADAEGQAWVRIEDDQGRVGFVSGDTQIKEVVQTRWCVERMAFVGIGAVVGGALVGEQPDFPLLGVMAMLGFGMASFYVTAKMFLGFGGFVEELPYDAQRPPTWDWKRFAFEPLVFLGVVVGCVLFVGLISLIRWALDG